jgi:hypothetical protein
MGELVGGGRDMGREIVYLIQSNRVFRVVDTLIKFIHEITRIREVVYGGWYGEV